MWAYLCICSSVSVRVYAFIDVYGYMYARICMCFIFKIDHLILSSFYLYFLSFFQDTECKLLIMCKGEVSISDSLRLPPFSNQVVK